MSLDVPFGDTFEILERWIGIVSFFLSFFLSFFVFINSFFLLVTLENNKVNVRILGESFFHSSPILKGTIHRAVIKGKKERKKERKKVIKCNFKFRM